MSAEIIDVSGGILTSRITGLLKHSDLVAVQKRAGEIIREQGKVRMLTVLENFEGLEKAGDWGDISFQMEFDDAIEKLAIVGDKKWHETAVIFTGKGVRRIPIEFFETADLEKARAWIASWA
jgi:hypothetical protein